MRDLKFISGEFIDHDVPRDKQYLLKYFTTELQVAFLRYALVFEDTKLFKEHTGFYCSDRLKFRLLFRFRKLIKLHNQAKASYTEEGLNTLQLIESGQYPLTGGQFS
jgi:hypothetical protein